MRNICPKIVALISQNRQCGKVKKKLITLENCRKMRTHTKPSAHTKHQIKYVDHCPTTYIFISKFVICN